MASYCEVLFSANNLPNLLLFAAALVAILMSVRTLRTIERQTKTAEVTATAQMDADRSWVLVSVAASPDEPLTGNLIKGIVPAIIWKIKVFGNTPVRIIRSEYRCRVVDSHPDNAFAPHLEPKPVYFPSKAPEGLIVYPPGHEELRIVQLEPDPNPNIKYMDRLSHVSTAFNFMCAYGRIEYEDVFKRKGVTQFCAIYKPPVGGVVTLPDGTVINPTGFHIGGPQGYNFNT